jgi:hypothetical protein
VRNSLKALVLVALAGVLLAWGVHTVFAQASAQQGAPPANTSGSAPVSPPQGQQPDATVPAPGHSLHSITVTFDYDFTRTPACTQKVREHCTQRFVVYDISAGYARRAKLFVIPVPDGAKGQMHGITATGPKLDFESGRHQIAVTAQEPSGVESQHYAATVWVVIP